ncbi:MAG: ISL3 family transposase [Candidatus Sulfotelmatobacter sp.]
MPVPRLRQTLRGGPPFAPAYARYTHRLQAFIEDLRGLMTVSDLAALTGLGWDTVKNIIKAKLEKDYGHPRLKELKRLSIDEIYLGRTQRFFTLVIDLDTGRIVWVARGRGGDTLTKFWRALRLSKAKIEAVAMDMSPAYWSAVLEHLPKAAVVFDRFHITKLVNEKLDDLRRAMVREATGPMKQTVKGVRYLLLMRRENVEAQKLPRLQEALKHNEPLNIGYLLKEALGLLWEQPSYAQMKSFLHEWCAWAMESGVRQMQQVAKTLLTHASGILSWWKHRINNGRMEGINNKIKTLLRQTYGLRDERYFVLRLYGLHTSRHELLG